MTKERLLIVDDEVDMLEGLRRMLSYELEDVEITTASEARQALSWVRQQPIDLALLDVRMPEIDGLELLEVLKKEDPWLTIIMMTAYISIEVAVEAMKRGAYDFVTKPFDKDTLIRVLGKGLERNRLIRENLHLRQRVGDPAGFEGFVGQALPMRRLYERIQTVAHTDYTVFIRGESGTGKELVARALHALSKRRNRPMVAVNCPAIPEQLLESELFGYKRGAFTGADRDHIGLFEEASGSSLFLDEIGDIPVAIQTKLLRALEEHEIKPLGASNTQKVNVRIIASTNRNIEKKIRDGSFREELYYRLNVVTLETPSLREIRNDIPLLVNRFAKMACTELGIPPKRVSAEVLEDLMNRSWPGNVRELQNLVRRFVVFSPDSVIRPAELRAQEGLKPITAFSEEAKERLTYEIEPYIQAKEHIVNQFTAAYVSDLLKKTGGNVTHSAELSGLGRASLQKIMRRLGIKSDKYKGEE
ncbi:MAG: sigma-54 dependent transcriptional regulator [Desulfobacterales bacterium]|nr:sigma-54 dependent transcriptional regulator [Pseudomonadota bacterium]MCG2777129.1 sigma-54 dependent transcriptional regulator [Desulfobacterales bacterium]